MFKITFANGSTLYYQGNATVHDVSKDVAERGNILSFERVDARPRRPRAFDVSQVVFDADTE